MPQPQASDSKLTLLKVARVVTYVVYAFTILAVIFLTLAFFLLLFGANPDVAFVQYVAKVAQQFLEPFRGIFPLHQLSETSYFSPSILFAIIIYMVFGLALNSLIIYLSTATHRHEQELAFAASEQQPVTKKA